jgi:small subunit ribosomal protein S16
MLTIRLQRTGKKNQADFRIVLAEKQAPVKKKFVEILGSYNPRKKDFRIKSEERLKYWIAQRVEISPTVHNLLVSKNLLEATKVKAFRVKKKEVEKPSTTATPTPSATDVGAEPKTESLAEVKTEEKPAEEVKNEQRAA